jgi:phosphate-selective porin OprO and OprP
MRPKLWLGALAAALAVAAPVRGSETDGTSPDTARDGADGVTAVDAAADPAPPAQASEEPKEPEKKKGFEVYWKEGATHFKTDGFGLEFSNRIQFRYTLEMPDASVQLPGTAASGDSEGSFKIRRAKTQLQGFFWKPEFTYELQIGWAGSDSTGGSATFSGLEDAMLNWNASKDGKFQIRLGQYKVPFGRQELTSSEKQEFADRSILSGEFTHSRDVGVSVWGQLAKGKVEYWAGLFNGNGRNKPTNDNSKYQYDLRLMFQPWGDVKYSEGDFESKDHALLEFTLGYEENDKANSTSAPPGGNILTNFDDKIVSFDSVLKYKGLFVYGDLYLRKRAPQNGPSFNSNGWIVQSGYMVKRDVFELAFRYAWWDPSDQASSDEQTEIGGVANYYVLQHRFKVQADYRQLKDRVQKTTTDELRGQVQLVF